MTVLVHQHLVVSAKVKHPLIDFPAGERWLTEIVALLDMQILAPATGAYCNEPGNRGLTILLPITTSHLALHIWDEPDPACLELDVYSCRAFDPALVYEHLSPLEPLDVKVRFLDRSSWSSNNDGGD